MADQIIVIRAGGTGTRLWPLSTAAIPKQFVPVLSKKSLLQETFERVRVFGVANIFITTNARHVPLVEQQLKDLPRDHIIAEPLKRNTGPAIAYETAVFASYFAEHWPGADPVIASIPADDFVAHPEIFVADVKKITEYLDGHRDEIVMPLTKPQRVDPGLSYVRAGINSSNFGSVSEWVEKPEPETCSSFIASGEWFVHTGMYFWKLSGAVKMFQEFAPDVWRTVEFMAGAVASGQRAAALKYAEQLPIVSIESLVTKKYPRKIGFQANNWGWSDVGKWSVVKDLLQSDEKSNVRSHEQVHFVNAENNLVFGAAGKRVVCVGVQGLYIVDNGEQLLVCRSEDAHEVGKISEQFGNG